MEQGTEYGLVDDEEVEIPGDEWEAIDVSETEADRIAKKRDRKFEQFEARIKDADQFKVEQSVFDDATLAALYKLVQDGYVEAFGGPLSTGKEANVYHAQGDGREVAVKVYRINASNFRQMRDYLEGDPRFEGLGGNKKDVVLAWTKKELANLKRAQKAGVRVPEPIATERNVLVMEYIGTEDGRAKRLGEVTIENPETAYGVMREYMRRLYAAGLIHGDLSEYNVVFDETEGQLVIIDIGQAVTVHHPNSRDFLQRDCENVATFFARQGIETDADELLDFVTNPEPDPSRD